MPRRLTTVVNVNIQEYDVYIGRPQARQPWGFGNPFRIGHDGCREMVINKFMLWLRDGKTFECADATPERRKWILDHVKELQGKRIACFCRPDRRCHGDILAELADAN